MKWALAGGSGLVGGHFRELALRNSNVQLQSLLRRNLAKINDQETQIILDFENKKDYRKVEGQTAVCALGTTIKKAGTQKAFRRIDYDYPLLFAEAALANGAKQFILVSSLGADSKSSQFYLRTKGEIEQAISALDFESCLILRPSLLLGKRKESRWGESLGQKGFSLLGALMIGPLAKYRGIKAADVAKVIYHFASKPEESFTKGTLIIESQEIQEIADSC